MTISRKIWFKEGEMLLKRGGVRFKLRDSDLLTKSFFFGKQFPRARFAVMIIRKSSLYSERVCASYGSSPNDLVGRPAIFSFELTLTKPDINSKLSKLPPKGGDHIRYDSSVAIALYQSANGIVIVEITIYRCALQLKLSKNIIPSNAKSSKP